MPDPERSFTAIKDMLKECLACHLNQGLWAHVSERFHAGAKASGQNHHRKLHGDKGNVKRPLQSST